MEGGDPVPLNKQIRGPNNTLKPMPSKPCTAAQVAPKVKVPSTKSK